MNDKVRVRFAPSPTGPLHIGGLRTALFNFLFAKKHNGKFILRIEDTDQKRYVEGAEKYIIDALKWCHISIDEGPGVAGQKGPYRQSERKNIYKGYVDKLIVEGKAYLAFDTPEELDYHRKNHEEKGKTFIYNWHNRLKLKNSLSLTATEVETKIKEGAPYVVRFKIPDGDNLTFTDAIRGSITIDTKTLDDKVIFKSDGMPTYHLANIVDDHLMDITHVIRGEEWLPSLALHILLYQAFNWPAPTFAHLPLLLKPTGKGKLSKRDGDKLGFPVFPLEWTDPHTKDVSSGYKEEGYLPEAVINFLALLGWNPGTEQEVFSLNELIEAFDLGRVHKAGARFDPDKIKWFNQHYFQHRTDEELYHEFLPIVKEQIIRYMPEKEKLIHIIRLLKPRAAFTQDLWTMGHFFFKAPVTYDEKAVKKAWKTDTPQLIKQFKALLEKETIIKASSLKEKVQQWVQANEIGFGKLMMPLRLCLVGSLQGPDVFEIIAVLGKQETIIRLNNALKIL